MKDTSISLRRKSILYFVIENFIETGEPIGSSHLIKKYSLDFSPATIRKELNSLMKLGLLSQSHKSSGRYPTESGMNYYIKNIINIDEIADITLSSLENEYNSIVGTLDHVVNESSHILSDFTHLTSLATLPPRNTLKIKSFELIQMGLKEYLLILIFDGGITEKTFIRLDNQLTDNQLNNISDYLNKLTYGLTIEQLKKIVLKRINSFISEYDELLEKVFRISSELFEKEKETTVLINGKKSILTKNNFTDNHKYEKLLDILEEQELLYKLLESVIEDDCTKVFIGSQNGIPDGFSLIAAPYKKGSSYGSLGVFGPYRMNYSQIIPIVNYTAKMVTKMVNGGVNE